MLEEETNLTKRKVVTYVLTSCRDNQRWCWYSNNECRPWDCRHRVFIRIDAQYFVQGFYYEAKVGSSLAYQ